MGRLHHNLRNKIKAIKEELEGCSGSEVRRRHEELLDLVEDLEVQQHVLEMQNEELRRAVSTPGSSKGECARFHEFSPAGYVITDGKGDIVRVSSSACDMLELPDDELKGKSFLQFVYPQDQGKYFQLIRGIARGEWVKRVCDLRLINHSSVPFFVQIETLPVIADNNQFIGWQFAFIDISERKKLERELSQSEAKYRSIFSAANDAIVLVDCYSGQILDINEFACELYGYSREEMLKLNAVHLSAEPERSERDVAFEAARTPLIYHRKKDGTTFPAEISSSYRMNGARRVSTMVIRDMSERQRTQKALKESEEQLRYLSARLLTVQEEERKAVATELHDGVVTSLAAIKYHVENLFQMEKPPNGRHKREFQKLLALIRSTFNEASRIMGDLRPSLLDDLGIVSAIRSLCRQYGEKNEQLAVEADVQTTEARVPEEIKVAIFRLLQDALKNVAEHSGASWVRVALAEVNGELKLSVEDNGSSFDLDSSHTYRKGLGLMSMKRRAEFTGGTFSIDSRAEGGTIISAAWPMEKSKATLRDLTVK